MSLESPPIELVVRYDSVYRWLIPRLNFLFDKFPNAVPTSWWRSELKNMEVGGAAYSQHLLGWAVDWALPAREHRAMVQLTEHLEMVGIDEGDHVHIQIFPAGVIPKTFFPQRFSV